MSPDDAAHVLWMLNAGMAPGKEPGGFTAALILAITRADPNNRALLALVYPGLVEAVGVYKEHPEGIEVLEAAAKGGRDG
jgi:hypothetical protein